MAGQVSLNQALVDLPAWFSFQSGKEFTMQAEATFSANQQNLIVRTVEAYLLVLRAQDNLAASKAQERAFERQLEQTQQRFEVGLIAITDVYEAQAAYDLSQVNRIVDENNVDVALERLSVLTGQPDHSNLNILRRTSKSSRRIPPGPRRLGGIRPGRTTSTCRPPRYAEEAARQTAKANRLEHAPKGSAATTSTTTTRPTATWTAIPPPAFDTPPTARQPPAPGRSGSTCRCTAAAPSAPTAGAAAQEFNAARENRINLTRNTSPIPAPCT